ncbi:MAG: hypothetical protein ACWA5A_15690 [Marinibacterium sp.]
MLQEITRAAPALQARARVTEVGFAPAGAAFAHPDRAIGLADHA